MNALPAALAPGADARALIQGLFDCPVGIGLCDPRAETPEVPEERAAIPRARVARRRAFRAGRHAARAALATFGEPVPVPMGEGGAPVWPARLTGSISHSRTACAAVIAHRHDVAALGLDVEEDAPLERALWAAVCTRGERAALGNAKAPGLAAKQLFCAKESVYKAQFPLSGRMLGFHDVEITVDAADASFTARFLDAALPVAAGAILHGRLARADGLIWAAVTVPVRGIAR